MFVKTVIGFDQNPLVKVMLPSLHELRTRTPLCPPIFPFCLSSAKILQEIDLHSDIQTRTCRLVSLNS